MVINIKILQIITSSNWAGAQRVVYDIVKGIKEKTLKENQIDVVVGNEGVLSNKLRDIGINVYIIKELQREISIRNDFIAYTKVYKLIKKNKYDVVHCHSTKAGIIGRMAAQKLGVRKIVRTRHGYWPIFQYKGIKRKLATMVERYFTKMTTDLVHISKSDEEISRKLKIGNDKMYRLVYNQIHVENVKKGILRSELGLDPDIRIIGNVSRVENQKNPLEFVEIANEYFQKNDNNNTKFVWVGDGSLLKEVEEAINHYGLKDKVLFIGFKENGQDYLADFNLLLMTSKWEGVPISILEAIELNIPILSTNVGGIKEIIGEDNIFRDKKDALKKLENLEKIKQVEYFSDKKMWEEYYNVYNNS